MSLLEMGLGEAEGQDLESHASWTAGAVIHHRGLSFPFWELGCQQQLLVWGQDT